VAAHGYFGRLDSFQYASFNNSRSLHFLLATWPVVGILVSPPLASSTMDLSTSTVFNFNSVDPSMPRRVIQHLGLDVADRCRVLAWKLIARAANAHQLPAWTWPLPEATPVL